MPLGKIVTNTVTKLYAQILDSLKFNENKFICFFLAEQLEIIISKYK